MNDTLSDIEKLKEAKILLEEGASDEKRMGISIIGNMISSKEQEIVSFEQQMELFFNDSPFISRL
tara:strand:+ start:2041 stop:2235 length:195 start_codon:yes stop_codon:yes gene_type:complete